MPKIRKVKRRKTYKVNINRKRLRDKLRKVPTITCPQIKEAWDLKKSTKTNLVQMGLSYDPNQSLKIPNIKGDLIKRTKRRASGLDPEDHQKHNKKIPKKIAVAQELEKEAKLPRERTFRLPKAQVHFLTYLMDKYADDYKAMSRDKKNYYQLTWKQIRQKINTFKGIPEQYAEYLVEKGEIVLDDPMSLEETRKKRGEENLKKYCQPKKKPEKKALVSQWIEEEIEEDNEDTFDTEVGLVDENEEEKKEDDSKLGGNKVSDGKKKLKLFPDDESDQESKKINDASDKKKGKTPKTPKKPESHEKIEKSQSSDSEDSEELEEEDAGGDFKNLSDMSDDELSEDDILDDGEFVTDSDDDSD